MLIFFGILILIFCILLGVIILFQNPKGGGVAGGLSGVSTQLLGVKQTTDILEKGTWIFGALVAILCIISPAFTPKDGSSNSTNDRLIKNTPATTTQQQVPANTVTNNGIPVAPAGTPAAGDTTKR